MNNATKTAAVNAPRELARGPASLSTPTNSSDDLHAAFALQRDTLAAGSPRSLESRRADLLRLQRLVEYNRLLFIEAANADFGTRSASETELSEIVSTVSAIRSMRRNLRRWMTPRRRVMPLWQPTSKGRVEPQPRGVVGVVAPWHFPVHMALIPTAAALAAGNSVIIRINEFTPRTSAVLARLVRENFNPGVLQVVDGTSVSEERFHHVPFNVLVSTGATSPGHRVGTGANVKNPVIVDRDQPVHDAAARVVWAKLVNGGQTPTSPDYVLVPRGMEMDFAIAARHAARTLYPRVAENPTYTAMLDEPNYCRLRSYISDAESEGLDVVPAEDLNLGKARRQLPLTVIINPAADSPVMQEEIFGPVLPVIGYDNENTAATFVNERPTAAILYVLAGGKGRQRRWIDLVNSASVVVNDLTGGFLNSELAGQQGAFLGREGFDAMSYLRSVTYQRATLARPGLLPLSSPDSRPPTIVLKLMRRL